VALVAALGGCDGCRDEATTAPAPGATVDGDLTKLPLNPNDVIRLAQQRKIVRDVFEKRYRVNLVGSPDDVPHLQRILDEEIFSRHHVNEREAVAVAFGDAIREELSLRWVMVMREHGTDPVLCCRKDGSFVDVVS